MKIPSLLFVVLAAATLVVGPIGVLRADEAKSGWIDNEQAALAKAKAEKKLVLLDFTGSDWCPYCIRMDKEVFDTPEFKDYAKDHLELVTVDFPDHKQLPEATVKQNEALKNQYHIDGFPTFIVLDGDGKTVKLFEPGYQEGGAKAFVDALKKLQS